MTRSTCYVSNCSKPVHAQGRCHLHYTKQRKAAQAAGTWEGIEVDAEPFKARIREFLDAGYNFAMMEAVTGIERNTFLRALTKDRKLAHVGNVERLEATPVTPLHLLWKTDIGVDYPVPMYLATRRVQALMSMGWSTGQISEESGITRRTVARIAFGEEPHHILRSSLVQLVETYNRLSMTTPPPPVRPTTAARYRHWPLPLEWDDEELDDPSSEPVAQARAKDRIRLARNRKNMAGYRSRKKISA